VSLFFECHLEEKRKMLTLVKKLVSSIVSFIKRNSAKIGRLVGLFGIGVVFVIVVVICLSVISLTVKQQWKWVQIVPTQKFSSRSVFIELEGFEKKEARFLVKSNNPDCFPCWLWFRMEHKGTKNFSVNHTWFRKIWHRLQLPEDTQDAHLEEVLILYVRTLSNASSLPLVLSLEGIPDIPNISFREALFGQKKSFAGTITILMGVPRNIKNDSDLHDPTNYSPICAFNYVVEFEPDIGSR